jgi:hypothetical protein
VAADEEVGRTTNREASWRRGNERSRSRRRPGSTARDSLALAGRPIQRHRGTPCRRGFTPAESNRTVSRRTNALMRFLARAQRPGSRPPRRPPRGRRWRVHSGHICSRVLGSLGSQHSETPHDGQACRAPWPILMHLCTFAWIPTTAAPPPPLMTSGSF